MVDCSESVANTNKPPAASTCDVSQSSNCKKSGTGPYCANDAKAGAAQKTACLNDVKKECDKKIKECVAKCNKDFKGTLAQDAGKIQIGKVFTDGAGSGGSPVNPAFWCAFCTPGQNWYYGNLERGPCMVECYLDIIDRCATAKCYCGLYACPGPKKNYHALKTQDTTNQSSDDNPNFTIRDPNINTSSITSTSAYGIPIEIVYSRSFMPGNTIWFDDVRTTRVSGVNTFYDADTNTIIQENTLTIDNLVNMHLALCSGEMTDILRVFIDDVIVFDREQSANGEALGSRQETYKFYAGTESQKVDKSFATAKGFGRVPANRGVCYISIIDINLSEITAAMQFRVEVIASSKKELIVNQSAALPGLTSSNIWTVDKDAGRIICESASGVNVLDYDTIGEVWSDPVANAIEVTQPGRIITYDTTNIGVHEHGLGESGNYVANLGITNQFLVRILDVQGSAMQALLSESATGDAFIEEIEEVRPLFPNDAIGNQSLPSLDTAPHDYILSHTVDRPSAAFPGSTTSDVSLFLFRVYTNAGVDTVRIIELRMFTADINSAKLLQDGQHYSYDLPASTFGNTSTLAINGVIPSRVDHTIIIFTAFSGANRIIKWGPDVGVVWTLDVPSMPTFHKYAPVNTDFISNEYAYYGPDGSVYEVDLASGTYTATPEAFPALAGSQHFDDRTGSITYHAAGDKIVRAFISRFAAKEETVGDVILDLARRSGIDVSHVDASDVSTIPIVGFRSGSNTDGVSILGQIKEIYQVGILSSDGLVARKKSTLDQITVNPDHYETLPLITTNSEKFDKQTTTVNYFSDDLDGEVGIQTFSLIRDDRRYDATAETTFTWTVLETDTYMRRLAEVITYAAQTSSIGREVTLPPRYLAITAGDVVVDQTGRRVGKGVIGANNFIKLELQADLPEQYQDLVSLTGIKGVTSSLSPAQITKVASPICFSMRGVAPVEQWSTQFHFGMDNILQNFSTGASVFRSPAGSNISPASDVINATAPMAWGRLTTPPEALTTQHFTTFKKQSMTIKFLDASMATRILAADSKAGQNPDYRTVDENYNLLAVGYELIQYETATPGPDSQSVTFTNLLRARQDTDYEVAHVVGDFCAWIEDGNVGSKEVTSAVETLKAQVTNSNGDLITRMDIMPDVKSFLPLPSAQIRRAELFTAFNQDPNHPDNRGIVFGFNGRLQESARRTFNNVDPSVLATFPAYPLDTDDIEFFLLRAPYNEAMFDAERNGLGTTYIVLRHPGYDYSPNAAVEDRAGLFLFFSIASNPQLAGLSFKVFDWGLEWRNVEQQAAATGWDYDTEPLNIVAIMKNPYGETRYIADWPVSTAEVLKESVSVRGYAGND